MPATRKRRDIRSVIYRYAALLYIVVACSAYRC